MISKYSSKNTYSDKWGKRWTSQEIAAKVRRAKALKIEMMLADLGYIRCEDCGINSHSGQPIDCSHQIPVKKCLESGRAELAHDVDNIKMRCRECHRKHDNS